MPAALVECAFISNQTEAELLKSDAFKEKCATGLFNGINSFASGIDKSSGSYSTVSEAGVAGFTVKIDQPENSETISGDFIMSGWAADLKNSPPIELAKVEIYNGQDRSEGSLLGRVSEFSSDVLGSEGVLSSGWQFNISTELLYEGENIIYVYAYDKDNNYGTAVVKVNIIKEEVVNIEPTANPAGPYSAETGVDITFDGSGLQRGWYLYCNTYGNR